MTGLAPRTTSVLHGLCCRAYAAFACHAGSGVPCHHTGGRSKQFAFLKLRTCWENKTSYNTSICKILHSNAAPLKHMLPHRLSFWAMPQTADVPMGSSRARDANVMTLLRQNTSHRDTCLIKVYAFILCKRLCLKFIAQYREGRGMKYRKRQLPNGGASGVGPHELVCVPADAAIIYECKI